MWAPVLGELPLGPCSNRQGSSPALHFSLLGSKLYVSSSQVRNHSPENHLYPILLIPREHSFQESKWHGH
uniref:Uncharacterized protein n=1 Tax=Arundo donax TaxID=35708 RepID=A0A0A8ZDZ6_ARUDO